jgi:hypothetical protein
MENFTEGYLKKVTRNSPIRWQNSGFAMLPNSLIFNANISRSGLLVYWVLTVHLFKGKTYCFPKIETIAKEARCDRRTVTRAIRELKDTGYLKVESTPGEVNRYKLKM